MSASLVLQLHVDDGACLRFTDHIGVQSADLGRFDVMPAVDGETSEGFEYRRAEPPDDAFKRNIVFMHAANKVSGRREILS